MATNSGVSGEKTEFRFLAAAMVPLGIVVLQLISGFIAIPDQPAMLLVLVMFSALLAGVWVGLMAALLQVAYCLWLFSGVEGAAPDIDWSFGNVLNLTLTDSDTKRLIIYGIASPLVAVVAGLSHRNLQISRLSTTAQEKFANVIFERAGVAIAYADMDGYILRCNQAYSEMVAYSPAETVGMNFRDLVDPRDREENWRLSRQLVAGLTDKFTLENRYIRKDGISVWARKVVMMIHSDSEQPSHLLLFATDLTDEMALKADLEKREADYRRLWESSGNANFLVFAPDFKIERGNEAAIRFFGARDLFQLGTLRMADLSPAVQDDGESSVEKERKFISVALQEGGATFEWLFHSLDRREIYASVKFTRVESDGRVGLQCTAVDITDRVLLSRHQADAQRRLAEEVNTRTAELEDVTYELHLAQSVGGMGSFSVDLVSGTFSCSPETARILNLEEFDKIAVEKWTAKVHPGDLQAVIAAWERAVAGATFDITYRIVVPDGVRYVKVGARIRRDSEGNALSAIGALLDLTSLLANREQKALRGYRTRLDGLLAATAAVHADAEQNIETDTRQLAESLIQQFPDWSADELDAIIEQAIATIKGPRP